MTERLHAMTSHHDDTYAPLLSDRPPIRVVLAEDSVLFVAVLRELFASTPDIEIVRCVDNGEDAVSSCIELEPDLVLMDVNMPRLDGLSATQEIMARCPTPILIITSDPHQGGVDISFKALSAGALDLFPKTRLSADIKSSAHRELVAKVRLLSQIPVIRHVRGRARHGARQPNAPPEPPGAKREARRTPIPPSHSSWNVAQRGSPGLHFLIGVVASTGGPRALATILKRLPSHLPATILVVQHITHGFTAHLARWLDQNSSLHVIEATDRARLRPGQVLIAPGGRHMELDDSGSSVRLRKDASSSRAYPAHPTRRHCPGGDELLHSIAAHAHAPTTLGIVLSGMGDDGSHGLLAMRQAGCTTIIQDEKSSVVWGMPGVAHKLGAAMHMMDPPQMVRYIGNFCKSSGPSSPEAGDERP